MPVADARREWLLRRRHALGIVLLSAVPLMILAGLTVFEARSGLFALDFHNAFWPAANAVLHGNSPYPAAGDPLLAAGGAYVYPPAAAILMAPLALLPHGVADVVMWVTVLLAGLAILRVAGVRDWRCYGALVLGFPFVNAVQTANVSMLLALGVALAWRYRDRRVAAAVLIALAVAAKMFVWPLLVWLLFTRWRTSLLAGAVTAAISVASWAIVGFGEIPRFLHDLGAVNGFEQDRAYTVYGLAVHIGVSSAVAHAAMTAAGLGLLVAAALVARRPAGDWRSFVLAIAASLVLSPIVWQHYLMLLIVPLAFARPRLDRYWLLPVAIWLCPSPPTMPHGWQFAIALSVGAALVYGSLRPRAAGSPAPTGAGARVAVAVS
jgi:alpha-1,2-mannosyltransferase